MERLLTPLKSGTKEYLQVNVVPALTNALTRLGIVRPPDPFIYLAQYFYQLSPNKDDYVFVKRDEQQHASAAGSAVQAVRVLDNHNRKESAMTQTEGQTIQPEEKEEEEAKTIEPEEIILENGHEQVDEPAEQQEEGYIEEEAKQTEDGEYFEEQQEEGYIEEEAKQTEDYEYFEEKQPQVNYNGEDEEERENSEQEEDSTEEVVQDDPAEEVVEEEQPIGDVVEDEREEDTIETMHEIEKRASESQTARVVKMGYRLNNVSLFIKATLLEDEGAFMVDARDVKTMEKYHFECEGVNYEKLRMTSSQDHEMVREMLKSLSFTVDEETGCQFLGLR